MSANVLIVEDEVLVARDIQARLSRMGYQVVGTASKGEEAVTMALQTNPDLILMDINLRGDMDGIEAAVKINECRSIPIIFCTAYSNNEVLERAKITSPFGYVLKPFDNRELEINIEIALFKHKVEKDLADTKMNLDATLKNVSDGVIAADSDGRIFLINPIAEKIAGCTAGDGFGKRLDEVLQLEAFDSGQASINLLDPETFAYWKQFSGLRQRLVRADGRRVPIEHRGLGWRHVDIDGQRQRRPAADDEAVSGVHVQAVGQKRIDLAVGARQQGHATARDNHLRTRQPRIERQPSGALPPFGQSGSEDRNQAAWSEWFKGQEAGRANHAVGGNRGSGLQGAQAAAHLASAAER